MKYGNTTFYIAPGSLSIVNRKNQEVRHYPYSDDAVVVNKGRSPTVISCTIVTTSESKRETIEEMLHTEGTQQKLYNGNYYYDDVVAGPDFTQEPIVASTDGEYHISARFVATDPIKYGSTSGVHIYD